MKIFKETLKRIHENTNNNFHFDNLDWTTQVWINELCNVIDRRLKQPEIKFQKLHDDVDVPKYMTPGSAGMDIRVSSKSDNILVKAGDIKVFDTGLKMSIPEGYEAQIRSRSGLAVKGICVVNSPGTIDSDYRGEIRIAIINNSYNHVVIRNHERIAQIIITRVSQPNIKVVDSLDETERNDGGFGSTGV